ATPAGCASRPRPARASKARRRTGSAWPAPSVHDLEQAGRAHAAADAHGDDHVLGLAAAALDQGVPGAAGAGHAEGMADRDRTTIDVELVVGDAQLFAAVEHLNRKGLVQLPEIDVVHLEAKTLQQLG